MNTLPRNAVLSLASLTEKLDDLARRALDPKDRYSDETDRDVRVELSVFMNLADNSVWACASDYDDDEALAKLQKAHERASNAWRHLRHQEPSFLVKLAPKTYYEFIDDQKAVRTTSNIALAWEANTAARAEQIAEDLRAHHSQPGAKVTVIPGARIQRARKRTK